MKFRLGAWERWLAPRSPRRTKRFASRQLRMVDGGWEDYIYIYLYIFIYIEIIEDAAATFQITKLLSSPKFPRQGPRMVLERLESCFGVG